MESEQIANVFCCNKCANKLRYKYNYRKETDTWACYTCGHIMDSNNNNNNCVRKRPSNFFTKKTRTKITKALVIVDGITKVVNNKIQYETIKEKVQKKSKRSFKDDDLKDRDTLLKELDEFVNKKDIYKQNKYDIRNPAFFAFLFLTGSRVEEVIGIREHDNDGVLNKKVGKWTGNYIVEPIRKFQITKTHYEKRDIITWDVENLPVLKRRGKIIADDSDIFSEKTKEVIIRRHVSVPYMIEKKFIEYIDKWLLKLDDNDIVFDFSPFQAWRICYHFNRAYNHLFRHYRATDLMITYGLQGLQLKHFFGWSSEAMAQKYAHLSKHSLLDAMLIGHKNKGEKIN